MQTITLTLGHSVSIEGAIINKDIIDFLLDLQQGIDTPGMKPRGENIGIKEYQKSYSNLILFMAKEADSFNDKEEFASWMTSIIAMKNMWSRLRIPGTLSPTNYIL